MAKEKVTLTLDADQLRQLRSLVGSRSLSSEVGKAVSAHLARLRHLHAVDEWLAEMELEHDPVPPATLEWGAEIVERWIASREGHPRRVG